MASLKKSNKQVPGCLRTEFFKDLPKKEKPQHHLMITGLCRALGKARLLSRDSVCLFSPEEVESLGQPAAAFPLAHAPQAGRRAMMGSAEVCADGDQDQTHFIQATSLVFNMSLFFLVLLFHFSIEQPLASRPSQCLDFPLHCAHVFSWL